MLVGSNNDNSKFSVFLSDLFLRSALDFETKANLVIDVQASDLSGQGFTKRFTINVTDANDPPHAINLSNNRIDENLPAGTAVGTLSSADVDVGDTHTYALVDGAGTDNNLFRIEGNLLKTNAPLDFENKPIFTVGIASTDNRGGSLIRLFLINVNNIPSPPDVPANALALCTGDPITLINQGAGIFRVLVQINNVAISNSTGTGCTVTGVMTITSNGSTVNNIPFRGDVNVRDQFSNASIPDFTISMAGVPLVARGSRLPISMSALPSTSSAHCSRCPKSLAVLPTQFPRQPSLTAPASASVQPRLTCRRSAQTVALS